VTTSRIRVLCVDDHRIVRDGVSHIINREADMEVVGVGSTAQEAVAAFLQARPDITLMDLRLKGMSGVDAIKAIRKVDPHARIVVLTMYGGDEDIHRALDAGVAAYLLKDTLSDDLIRVVRQVHAGKRPPVDADLRARLAERAARPTLTPREIEVLKHVATGLRNKEIGALLGITDETVQVHMKNILAKLEVNDRTAAVSTAVRRGIIHL
jgi:DNA-binding NarL/FixJ family response regulator